MALSEPSALEQFAVYAELDDVSAASEAFVIAPYRGRVLEVHTALHGAITTADSTVTAEINGTAITGISITITQSGSAAGDADSAEATGANAFEKGDVLSIVSDGSSATTRRLTGTFICERI